MGSPPVLEQIALGFTITNLVPRFRHLDIKAAPHHVHEIIRDVRMCKTLNGCVDVDDVTLIAK